MKRYWHIKKWKLRQWRRRRKACKREGRYLPTSPPTARNRRLRRTKNPHILIAPVCFSIIKNPEGTLDFFARVSKTIQHHAHVLLDMSKVEIMTPDSILYLLSMFDRWSYKKHGKISGNAPIDEHCRRLFIESGFLRYVNASIGDAPTSPDMLSIQSGNQIEPTVSKNVVDFSRRHLGQDRNAYSKSVYATVIECMSNTHEHAYEKHSRDRKWWLMALHESEPGEVTFAFLDNGVGIPATVRRNFADLVSRMRAGTDTRLIQSALDGEFRTKTKLGYRGKGLPRIYSDFRNGRIKSLAIVSLRGYVNRSAGDNRGLHHECHGTLFTWRFVAPSPIPA